MSIQMPLLWEQSCPGLMPRMASVALMIALGGPETMSCWSTLKMSWVELGCEVAMIFQSCYGYGASDTLRLTPWCVKFMISAQGTFKLIQELRKKL